MSMYEIQIDTINGSVGSIAGIPRESLAVAGYVTGPPEIMWTPDHWGDFPLAGKVHIDQTQDLAAFASRDGDVADIETGAATIETFINAATKRAEGPNPWDSDAYIGFGSLTPLRDAVTNAGLVAHVGYWVANWNLSMSGAIELLESDALIQAVQFASPTSNPNTLLPGSTFTLSQVNCDLSVKRASWFPSDFPAAIAWNE